MINITRKWCVDDEDISILKKFGIVKKQCLHLESWTRGGVKMKSDPKSFKHFETLWERMAVRHKEDATPTKQIFPWFEHYLFQQSLVSGLGKHCFADEHARVCVETNGVDVRGKPVGGGCITHTLHYNLNGYVELYFCFFYCAHKAGAMC